MKGYLFNSLLVAVGSALGLFAGKSISEGMKESVFSVLGLVTMYVGIKMSLNGSDIIPIVFALSLGTLLGSAIRFEEHVHNALNGLNRSYLAGRYDIEGFLIASTLFCVGSMTILGSLKDGLYNDATLIRTKSVMDGFASFVLASRYGLSVAFSALSVLVIQGGLTLCSGSLTSLSTPWMMNTIDGVGGIIVIAIGMNLLKIKTIKTLDMLPSLALIIAYGLWMGY